MKTITIDKLKIYAYDTRNEMGAAAGEDAIEAIKKAIAFNGFANVLFAAAPSQNEVLETVCSSDIDWSKVNAFHMDEYIGLDPSHSAGFRNFLKRAIFDKFKFKSVNLLNGNAPDIEKETDRYSQLLKDNPLDVCLMGIGENGHIAFNDPPVADFNDTRLVKAVKLDDKCRNQQVHDGCFSSLSEVPTHALTVTVPGIMAAKHLVCSVPSKTKAEAVRHLVNDEITTKCPCTIMRRHSSANMYVDKDAASLILQREET